MTWLDQASFGLLLSFAAFGSDYCFQNFLVTRAITGFL
jgi:hypothetical protein